MNRPYLVLYYIAQFLKARMIYRADFAAEIATFGVGLFFQLAYLGLLLSTARSLGDWTPAQVAFIWGAALVPNGLFDVVSPNLFGFASKHINQGGLDRLLLRPLPVLPQVFLEHVRFGALSQSLVGLILMTFAGAEFGWFWTPGRALTFALLAFCGALIIIAVFVMIACISFWSQNKLGLGAPVFNMLHFGRWPLKIFHPFVQFILTWVLPFALIGYFPATFLMDATAHLPAPPLVLVPAMAVFCCTAALGLWRLGIRNYTSVGA